MTFLDTVQFKCVCSGHPAQLLREHFAGGGNLADMFSAFRGQMPDPTGLAGPQLEACQEERQRLDGLVTEIEAWSDHKNKGVHP
jgi:hypothetical protein